MNGIGSCLRLLKRKRETAHTHTLLHHRMGLGSPKGKGYLNLTVETDPPSLSRLLFLWPLYLSLLLQIIFFLKSRLYLLGNSKHFYPSALILPNRTLTLLARLLCLWTPTSKIWECTMAIILGNSLELSHRFEERKRWQGTVVRNPMA